jgi:hypothetical protein
MVVLLGGGGLLLLKERHPSTTSIDPGANQEPRLRTSMAQVVGRRWSVGYGRSRRQDDDGGPARRWRVAAAERETSAQRERKQQGEAHVGLLRE